MLEKVIINKLQIRGYTLEDTEAGREKKISNLPLGSRILSVSRPQAPIKHAFIIEMDLSITDRVPIKLAGVLAMVYEWFLTKKHVDYFTNSQIETAMDRSFAAIGRAVKLLKNNNILTNVIRDRSTTMPPVIFQKGSVLTTGCPSCLLTIGGNLEPEANIKLMHPVELVKKAIENRKESSTY